MIFLYLQIHFVTANGACCVNYVVFIVTCASIDCTAIVYTSFVEATHFFHENEDYFYIRNVLSILHSKTIYMHIAFDSGGDIRAAIDWFFFFFHLVDACNCKLHLASRKNNILKCSICMRVARIQIIIINCNFISLYATLCIYSCIDDASNTSYIVCLPNTKTKKNKIKSNLH